MNVLVPAAHHALASAPFHTRRVHGLIRVYVSTLHAADPSQQKKVKMASIRWAFKYSAWQPDQDQWLLASSSVQPEEKDRIGQFVFTKDAKSAMAGRLLARKAVHQSLGIPWDDIILARTDRGKPFLKNKETIDASVHPSFNFNTSHHGDYAVLATEPRLTCGVDVMKVVRPNQAISEFFRTMKKQFTPYEWKTIMTAPTKYEQLHMFYRHWCLKESYIKALGIGLGFDLQRAEFHLGTLELSTSSVATDTTLYLRDRHDKNWVFHETMLDDEHYVAVALQRSGDGEPPASPIFTILSPEELLSTASPMHPRDLDYWKIFASRQEAPNLPNRKPLEKDQ